FGSGSSDLRIFGAIDIEQVVALAEPSHSGLDYVEHRAHVVAAAFDIYELVILACGGRPLLTIVAVKVRDVWRKRRVFLPIHVVIKHRDGAVSFIGHGDLAGFAERHLPVAVAGAAERADADGHGVQIALIAVADAEEIAQWNVDAGS